MTTPGATRLPLVQFLERRSRRQRLIALGAIGLCIAWIALRATARVLLDRWWLESVTTAPVWGRRTAAQLQLGVSAAVIVLVVVGSTVWIVLRVAEHPMQRPHRMWQRYDDRIGPAHRWALVSLTLFLAWHIGRAATGEWQAWLLFRHGGELGVEVPRVGGDLGFHLFRLPLLVTASSFLLQILLVALGLAVFGHLASGALRLPWGEHRTAPAASTHLTLLASVFLAVLAVRHVIVGRAVVATARSTVRGSPRST